MLRFVLRQGSIARWWDGRHCGRSQEGNRALHVFVDWCVVCDSVDAIAAVLRNFGTAAGGVCWRGRSRGSQDGRERLVGGRRRCARPVRSLPELCLERRGPHGDNCRRDARIGGAFVVAEVCGRVQTSHNSYGAEARRGQAVQLGVRGCMS
jgi:hypothetical protein